MTRGWQITGAALASVIFVLALADPAAATLPLVGSLPPVPGATVWAAMAFTWIWLVANLGRGLCWFRGSCTRTIGRD
jgi:hypothetical protein